MGAFNPSPTESNIFILRQFFPYHISYKTITENEKTKAKRKYEIFTILPIRKLLRL